MAAGTQSDDEGVVGVLVSYDMVWQKRGKAIRQLAMGQF